LFGTTLPGKTIILGTLDLSDMAIEAPETVAARIRRALPHVRAERIVVAAGLRVKVPAARCSLWKDLCHGPRSQNCS
jgi:hypothetical protein